MLEALKLRGPMKQQTVGEFILEWRLSKGYGQKDLGALLGVTKAYVSSIELDKYDHPRDFILKLKPLMTKQEYSKLVEVSCNAHRAGLE